MLQQRVRARFKPASFGLNLRKVARKLKTDQQKPRLVTVLFAKEVVGTAVSPPPLALDTGSGRTSLHELTF
jgi:hypothetical protein